MHRKLYKDLSRRQQLRRLKQQSTRDFEELQPLTRPSHDYLNINDDSQRSEVSIEDSINTSENVENFQVEEDTFQDDEESEFLNRFLCESDDEEEEEILPSLTLWEKVAVWALRNYTNRKSINEILSIFISEGHDLPKDARTLLGRSRRVSNIVSCGSGDYLHYGLERSLTDIMKQQVLETPVEKNIVIDINIDGLPLSKSSKSQLWPILGRVLSPFQSQVFFVGSYHGYEKPSSCIDDYLKQFIQEYKELNTEGFFFNHEKYSISINAVICDSPARAMVTLTKPYNGYFGCPQCTDEGEYMNNKICFPSTTSSLRSDETFSLRLQEEHHTGDSPFEEIGLQMVSQFPLDPMHLVDLGLTKKIVRTVMRGKVKACKLTGVEIDGMSKMLLEFNKYLPCEFVRKMRALDEVKRWKAVECRLFFYYLAPTVLEQFLPDQYCLHFNALHAALSILSCPNKFLSYNECADELLHWYTANFPKFYGESSSVYTVHCTQHLAQQTKRQKKTLYETSSYPFENYMLTLKKMIRRPSNPLPQLFHGFNAKSKFSSLLISNNKVVKSYPKAVNVSHKILPFSCSKEYDFLIFENFRLTSSEPNNCCYLKNNDVFRIEHITEKNGTFALIGRIFMDLSSFPNYPGNSQDIGLVIAKTLSEVQIIYATEIANKAVVFRFKESFHILPLLHSSTFVPE